MTPLSKGWTSWRTRLHYMEEVAMTDTTIPDKHKDFAIEYRSGYHNGLMYRSGDAPVPNLHGVMGGLRRAAWFAGYREGKKAASARRGNIRSKSHRANRKH